MDDIATISAELIRRTVLDNVFIPCTPTVVQAKFLANPLPEVMLGGQAAGGKSAAGLMAALQFVDVPGYAALVLRRSYADLKLPGALIDLSHRWLTGTAASWDGVSHAWRFPAGTTLQFGYLDNQQDQYRYQSAAFSLCFFDELTQFTESQYLYLFSRLRKPERLNIPLRMRSATNPGGIGHDWVKRRFLVDRDPDRAFIPARLEDNPHIDRKTYEQSLSMLDPVTRAQLRHGNWDIRPEGNLFRRAWFRTAASAPAAIVQTVRAWDLAATPDGDFTCGVRMALTDDARTWISDVVLRQCSPRETQALVTATAKADGKGVGIRLEQEPGSAGKLLIDSLQRGPLFGYDVRGVRSTGDKITRAGPFSSACEAGNVYLRGGGAFVGPFLDQLCAFPEGAHDDAVDAATLAFSSLTNRVRSWGAGELAAVFDRRQQHLTPHDSLMERIKAARNPDVCHGSSVYADGANSGR